MKKITLIVLLTTLVFAVAFSIGRSQQQPMPYDLIATLGNSSIVSTLPSYIGVVNNDYLRDDGSRFYILPKATVTTGTGGALKIFGDPYHLIQDREHPKYRDMGLYFSADQQGDTGYYGNGAFWMNSKVAGEGYLSQNPDLGFCFQDGQVIGGRWIMVNMDNSTKGVLIIGPDNKPIVAATVSGKNVRVEVQGDIYVQGNVICKNVIKHH